METRPVQWLSLPDSTGYLHLCLAPGNYENLSGNMSATILAMESKNIEIRRLQDCIENHNAVIEDDD